MNNLLGVRVSIEEPFPFVTVVYSDHAGCVKQLILYVRKPGAINKMSIYHEMDEEEVLAFKMMSTVMPIIINACIEKGFRQDNMNFPFDELEGFSERNV